MRALTSLLVAPLLLSGCGGAVVYVKDEPRARRAGPKRDPHAEIHRLYRMARRVGYQQVSSPSTTNLRDGTQLQTAQLTRTRWILRQAGQSVANSLRRRAEYLKLPPKERTRYMRRVDQVVQLWWMPRDELPAPGAKLLSRFDPPDSAHSRHREVAFLGESDANAWFIFAPIPTWVELQSAEKLTGGSDPVAAVIRGLAVRDPGGWTAFSCFDLLAGFGPQALDAVKKAVAKKRPQRGSAIRALGRHPDTRIGQALIRWVSSADPKVAGAARRALLEYPRRAAAALYERWLAAAAGKQPTLPLLRAIEKADVRQAVPHLQKVLARPHSVQEYLFAFRLSREFVGPEIPAVLSAATQTILKHGLRAGPARTPDPQAIDAAVEKVLSAGDAEAIAVTGLRLALFVSKGDYRAANRAGLEILERAPKDAGQKLVTRLGQNLQGTDLLKIQKLGKVLRGLGDR
jgi:hypothetical protein